MNFFPYQIERFSLPSRCSVGRRKPVRVECRRKWQLSKKSIRRNLAFTSKMTISLHCSIYKYDQLLHNHPFLLYKLLIRIMVFDENSVHLLGISWSHRENSFKYCVGLFVFFIQLLQFRDWLQLAKNREWNFSSNAKPKSTVSSVSTFFFSFFVTFKHNTWNFLENLCLNS